MPKPPHDAASHLIPNSEPAHPLDEIHLCSFINEQRNLVRPGTWIDKEIKSFALQTRATPSLLTPDPDVCLPVHLTVTQEQSLRY